jgi:predicted acetyltransferase
MMGMTIHPITEDEVNVIQNLFEYAVYDLSELNNANIKKSGRFEPKINAAELYRDNNYYLYTIQVDDQLAGFVIVKYIKDEQLFYLNHFFILRKYRKQGIGRRAAYEVFDRFKGNWRVSQFEWNVPAQLFWRNVLDQYTKGSYTETRRADDKGPSQHFRNDIRA